MARTRTTIRKITHAEVVHYVDNLTTRANVSWIDTNNHSGTTSGALHSSHMHALLQRAMREDVPVSFHVQGWIPDDEELARREKAAKPILRAVYNDLASGVAGLGQAGPRKTR